ncbi:hypothetical protein BCE_3985 [Bacillus cereus ATCC 10987]|uniref:Uncharacterized protein n=1 Tax=Bacillus cereus (strain ATCC 10987 / NRS 248) TaxID=222523 RepID=Q732C9_BACC1|nr:hypothetical protein BCE_3985 [Bacillus cereus ATCC 10987]
MHKIPPFFMLHHYFYNSMNNKKVQFILREKG